MKSCHIEVADMLWPLFENGYWTGFLTSTCKVIPLFNKVSILKYRQT
jgi:hypothetical protein